MKYLKRTLLIALSLLLLTSCGAPKPSSVVDAKMKELKSHFAEVLSGEGSDLVGADRELYDEIVNAMKGFDYEIQEETVNGENAEVKVKITTYALGTSFANAFTEYFNQAFALALGGASEEQLQALLFQIWTQKIRDEVAKGKNYSTVVKLALTKKDGNWVFVEDKPQELINALTGNLLSIIETFSEQ